MIPHLGGFAGRPCLAPSQTRSKMPYGQLCTKLWLFYGHNRLRCPSPSFCVGPSLSASRQAHNQQNHRPRRGLGLGKAAKPPCFQGFAASLRNRWPWYDSCLSSLIFFSPAAVNPYETPA